MVIAKWIGKRLSNYWFCRSAQPFRDYKKGIWRLHSGQAAVYGVAPG